MPEEKNVVYCLYVGMCCSICSLNFKTINAKEKVHERTSCERADTRGVRFKADVKERLRLTGDVREPLA